MEHDQALEYARDQGRRCRAAGRDVDPEWMRRYMAEEGAPFHRDAMDEVIAAYLRGWIEAGPSERTWGPFAALPREEAP